jgi:hypothetical protein
LVIWRFQYTSVIPCLSFDINEFLGLTYVLILVRYLVLADGSRGNQVSNQNEDVSETQKFINVKGQARNNTSVLKTSNYQNKLLGDNSYNNQMEAFQKRLDGARSKDKSTLWNSITQPKPQDMNAQKSFINVQNPKNM